MKPYTNAKTVYGLLNAVARIVLEEPRRLNMKRWRQTPNYESYYSLPPKGFPDCNTVCCIGGWMETLVPGFDVSKTLSRYYMELCYPAGLLEEALAEAQTPEHAQKTVAHIRAFQKKYKTKLQAMKLPGVK